MRIISPSLLNKLKDKNQTVYNNAEPKMNISLARARSSIMDSSYFTVETIRTKVGIGDISIGLQRLNPYGPPNAIYEMHIDNGIAKTSIRKYPDKRKEGWKDQFEVGPAISVAICFDGRWERNSKMRWQIVTDEKPYIFYVKPNNKLYYRIWDSEEEFLLAENVRQAKAIRGWKSAVVGTDDHGLIASYIKIDGKVYYRNLCEQEDGKYIWELEKQVTEITGTTRNINLFITNDYRTGFIIEDNYGKIKWSITARNWAGMAIASDKILTKSNMKLKFTETTKYNTFEEERIVSKNNLIADFLYASSFNEFVDIENIDDGQGDFGKLIRFKTRFELFNLSHTDFSVVDIRGVKYNSTNISKINLNEYLAEFYNINNAQGEIKFICSGVNVINAAGLNFDIFHKIFTSINLVPVEIPPPKVTKIKNIGDKEVLIEFDKDIVSEVETSLSAFKIESVAWKDSFEDMEINENHEVISIEKKSNKSILLRINPLERIRRANNLTVKYESTKGFLFGESDPAESFIYEFKPNIDKVQDPSEREKIFLSQNIDVDFIKIRYNHRYDEEKITLAPNMIVNLISVGEINP